MDNFDVGRKHGRVPRRAPIEGDRSATRASFVERLRDWGDDASWALFISRYGKLIHRVAQRAGLRPDEADDVVQETALSVARKMPDFVYQPGQCSFEGWVRRMARLRILDQLRRRGREERVGGEAGVAAEVPRQDGTGTSPEDVPVADADAVPMAEGDEAWAEEWKQMILDRALERVRLTVSPEHYQIFFMTVLEERHGADVARILDVSQAKVYVVRHRLMGRLQKEVDKVRAESEAGAGLGLDGMAHPREAGHEARPA